MAGIIETFKLDMADEHDVTFAEAGEIISMIVNVQKELQCNVARQRIIIRKSLDQGAR